MGSSPLDLSQFGGSAVQPQAQPSAQSAPEQAIPLDLSQFGGSVVKPPVTAAGPGDAAAGGLGKYIEGAAKVATGFAEGAGDTVSAVSHLLHKIPGVGETLAPAAGITALDKKDVPESTEEMAGKGIEGIAEFAAGDEALKGASEAVKLVALAKKYPAVAEVLNMAKEHPILAKLITGGSRGATVGAAQGAKEGLQKGNTAAGAEAGAAGGALTGPLEAASEADLPRAILKMTGLGGWTSGEAMDKAGRPAVTEGAKFATAWHNAAPVLKDIPNNMVRTVGDFEDALHDKANQVWQNDVQPIVDKHAAEVVDGKPIRDNIRDAISNSMTRLNRRGAADINKLSDEFNKNLTVKDLNEDLQYLNATLKKYYRAAPGDKASIIKTDSEVAGYEAAADGIRDQLYKNLDRLEGVPTGVQAEIRKQYGAIRDLERTFGKRAVVADRAAPLNLPQMMGGMEALTAVLAGHPLLAAAGALPWVVKARTAPESLIRQGLAAVRSEAGNPDLVRRTLSAVGQGLAKATPPVATQAAQSLVPEGTAPTPAGFVRVQDSIGGIHEIPGASLAAAQQRDPALKIMEGGK